MAGKAHWTGWHTVAAIILLISLISVFKNPFIYFKDYARAFKLTDFQYSIILLSLYVGNVTSLFFGVYVNNLFKEKFKSIASIFAFVSGFLSLLFCIISTISISTLSWKNSEAISALIVVYASVIAFLYKNAASICYATVVGLASQYSAPNKKGSNISLLQLSWSVSTLLYIPIGFTLDYLEWYVPFLAFGLILLCYSFIIHWAFAFDAENDHAADTSHSQLYQAMSDATSNLSALSSEMRANLADLKSIFNKQINLILVSIFFCSVAQGSFLITTSSFWMEDVYHLDASKVGLVTLAIFAAETVGALIMTQISDVFGVFVCTFLAFGIEIVSSLVILNLAITVGPDIGGLHWAVILNFFLFLGWEIFFITQVLSMIEFGPINVSKNIILLSNFAVSSVAKMIGAEFSTFLWYNGNGIGILATIWLLCNVFALSCYLILYLIKDRRDATEYMPIMDGNEDTAHAVLLTPNQSQPAEQSVL